MSPPSSSVYCATASTCCRERRETAVAWDPRWREFPLGYPRPRSLTAIGNAAMLVGRVMDRHPGLGLITTPSR